MTEPINNIQDEQIPVGATPPPPTDPIPEVEVTDNASDRVTVEEFSDSGDTLVTKVRELIHEGNIRRIIIKNEQGDTLLEIPLTVGIVGGVVSTVMFPLIAALGAIGALVARLTIVIERRTV